MLVFYFGLLFVANSICKGQSEQVNKCGSDYFSCNDGSCVEKSRWCDSKTDCVDDSDEDYCFLRSGLISNPNRCNLTRFFLCGDGRCIPAIGRCDGYSSCDDNSDEDNCKFTPSPLTVTIERSTELNRKDSETFKNLHDGYEMQADHAHSTEIGTMMVDFSTTQSNTSDDISSPILHLVDKVSEPTPSNGNVSINITSDLKENSMVLVKHKQALEFREILSLKLNASQNESTTTLNSDISQKSISLNRTSSLKIKMANKEVPHNDSKFQSDKSNNIHFIHKKNPVFIKHQEDMHKGYVELNSEEFEKAKEKALHWLIHSRDGRYGWGEETARALIALRMADSLVGKTKDDILMSKELHLKLFTLLDRNKNKTVPLEELALYINALSASCDNPKNFYGHNLVNILRHNTDDAQKSQEFVSPLVYMVLCRNDESSDVDIIDVKEMMNNSTLNRTDSEALVSLAATCLSRMPRLSFTKIGQITARKLYLKVTSMGLPRNIYELALVTQALNEARVNQDLWNRTEAMHRITHLQEKNGSFGDILSTYFAVPTLSGRSFLSIGKTCPTKSADFVPTEALNSENDKKMDVYYSLHFGNPVEMTITLTVMVNVNTSFMDIMRRAATINSNYEFKYDATEGKPIVYSIGGIANDAEKGLYWTPYVTNNSEKELQHFEGDIRNFSLAPGEEMGFWRKPLF